MKAKLVITLSVEVVFGQDAGKRADIGPGEFVLVQERIGGVDWLLIEDPRERGRKVGLTKDMWETVASRSNKVVLTNQ